MPNKKRTHEECRSSVCLLCLRKGDRVISQEQRHLIQTHVYLDYSRFQNVLPGSLCSTCRLKLQSQGSTKPARLPPSLNFEQMAQDLSALGPETRSGARECNCKLCLISSSRAHKGVLPCHPYGPPSPQQTQGMHVRLGRPTISEAGSPPFSQLPQVLQKCQKCNSQVAKGRPHLCSDSSKKQNYKEDISPRSKEHIASSVLKEKFAEAASLGSKVVSLSHGQGPPLKVQAAVGSGSVRRELQFGPVSTDTLLSMKEQLNLSKTQTEAVGKVLRHGSSSKKTVQSGLREVLYSKGKTVSDHFKGETKTFLFQQGQSSQEVSRHVVLCNSLPNFLTHVCLLRERPGTRHEIKLGVDGGGGSLKICANIEVSQEKEQSDAERSQMQSPEKKKQAISHRFKDSGVKRLMILGIVEDVQESYNNLKVMFDALDIESIHFTLAADFKCANILAGIQSHSSTFPCIYCEGTSPWKKGGKRRTLGSIRALSQAFQNSGQPWNKAKNYKNCVNLPLIPGEDEEFLLDLVPPPELHIMLGVVNKLLDELNTLWGNNRAYAWSHAKLICRENYHGGTLEGNACVKLLQKAPELVRDLPNHLKDFAWALNAFDLVRKSCFGQELHPDYKEKISKFQERYIALNISVTPKLHVLFSHVPEFCQKVGKGLGSFSEQASESVHSDFNLTWQRYRRQMNHPQYQDCFLRAVVDYNSFHVYRVVRKD